MRAGFRLYLNTSKGNDSFLYRQLINLKTRPKYDEHLHAFYLDAPLSTLFHLSFHSFIAQNMWIQIGKPFPAVSQQTFPQHLQKIQFKNYLPMKRGLIENMTLNILIRQTQYPLSDRVITSFLENALEKEIFRKEYHQNIVKVAGGFGMEKLPYYQLREIVNRKWEQQDYSKQEKYYKLLSNRSSDQQDIQPTKALPSPQQQTSTQLAKNIHNKQNLIIGNDDFQNILNKQFASQLPYHPNLIFYVRKNQGRLLLKINKQEMYKHGWKRHVGWGPIRQSIVAAILTHTRLLQQPGNIKIWDPFCGSATIPIVSTALYYSLKVRGKAEQNFIWPHWNIYKQEYLEQYLKQAQQINKQRLGRLKLICSDNSFQAVNYTINNLKQLQKSMPTTQSNDPSYQNVKRVKPTDQIYQLRQNEWSVLCGDFEQISKNVFFNEEKINIITNLPYTQSRSKDHIPLNQLQSIYRRFNKMVNKNKDKIANVFVIMNNSQSQISSPYHFLKVSEEKWEPIASFDSGGLPIGLFAWGHNQLKTQFFDTQAIRSEIIAYKNDIESITDDSKIHQSLVKYRERIQQIQKKNYYIPKHLLKFKKGFKRVIQKRRRRHLLRAYELFAKRRDKMIAFAQYSKKKLEVNMLRRGYIWRKRNMRLLGDLKIEDLEGELKKEFQNRIKQALERSQQKQNYRRQKMQNIKKQKQARQQEVRKLKLNQYLARKAGERGNSGKKQMHNKNEQKKKIFSKRR